MSATEQATIAAPHNDHPAAFLKAWTCKEALLKATGEGLVDSLPEIEVCPTLPGPPDSWPSGGSPTRKQRGRWPACLRGPDASQPWRGRLA